MSAPMENSDAQKKVTKSTRKPLVVRQTRTSKMRMEQGNQLSFYQNKLLNLSQQIEMNATAADKPKTEIGKRNLSLNKTTSTCEKTPSFVALTEKKAHIDFRKPAAPKPNKVLKTSETKPTVKQTKKPEPPQKTSFVRKNITKKEPSKTVSKDAKPKPVRKSLTSIHFKRVKCDVKDTMISRTKTMFEIPETRPKTVISPIIEVDETPEFKTPLSYLRRSAVYTTPMSSRSYYSPYPSVSASTNAPDVMAKLETWLTKRGKSLGTYHHLKCFNLRVNHPGAKENSAVDEENKENIETLNDSDESYKELNINEESKEKKQVDLFNVAKDALHDLQKLILDGYHQEQCEIFLQLIKSKCPKIDDHYQYWECKASLEEKRGEFSSAVECYEQAIIKGAQIKQTENSLDNLLQKFSVLNISPAVQSRINGNNETKKSSKTILDARNIFKSYIINFAISKQKNKENTEENNYKLIATPVRRSTRLSRTNYTSTPGVTLCGSISKLDAPLRESLHFQTNKAL